MQRSYKDLHRFHKSLRKFWEDQIGVPLPPDAEVWSKPRKEDEIYNYEDFMVKENVEASVC